MNETIGAKGGKRDRKQTLIITTKNKKKIQAYYKEKKKLKLQKLEKEVKNLQLASFAVALPIAIAGNVYNTITQKVEKETREAIKSLQIDELHKAEKLELNETSVYIEDYQTNDKKFTDYAYPKTIDGKQVVDNPLKEVITLKSAPDIVITKVPKTRKSSPTLEEKEDKKESVIETAKQIGSIENNILDKAKDKKLVAVYEGKLKDLREELKNLIYEYNVLVSESEDVYTKENAEKVLDQLNKIIKKIEELKNKIKVEIKGLEEEDYVIELVDIYLENFQNKTPVDEIKDSDLYIMLSEKIEEFSEKTQGLNEKLEDKKDQLEIDEEKLKQLKDKYYDYNKFNNELLTFQYEQEIIIKNLKRQAIKSISEVERQQQKLEVLAEQAQEALAMLRRARRTPGLRGAAAAMWSTLALMNLMNQTRKLDANKRKYRPIIPENWGSELEINIDKVTNILSKIGKVSNKLEEMIKEIETDFKDYLDELPECKELLSNLNTVLSELKEKEEEMERIKKNQEKLLTKTNEKVKTLTE